MKWELDTFKGIRIVLPELLQSVHARLKFIQQRNDKLIV